MGKTWLRAATRWPSLGLRHGLSMFNALSSQLCPVSTLLAFPTKPFQKAKRECAPRSIACPSPCRPNGSPLTSPLLTCPKWAITLTCPLHWLSWPRSMLSPLRQRKTLLRWASWRWMDQLAPSSAHCPRPLPHWNRAKPISVPQQMQPKPRPSPQTSALAPIICNISFRI